MDREGYGRLLQLNAVIVVAWRVVVIHVIGVNRGHELRVRGSDGRGRCWGGCIGLHRCDLGRWCWACLEIVGNRRPPLAKTSGVHAGNHGHESIDV